MFNSRCGLGRSSAVAMLSVLFGCGSPLDSKCWLGERQDGYRPIERAGTSSIGHGEDGSYVLAVGTRCGFMCRARYNSDPCVDCDGNNIGGCRVSKDEDGNLIVVLHDGDPPAGTGRVLTAGGADARPIVLDSVMSHRRPVAAAGISDAARGRSADAESARDAFEVRDNRAVDSPR